LPRLGFVSGDFRRHPVAYFTIRVLEALAEQGMADIYCYANQGEDDAYTKRFRSLSREWRDIRQIDDAELDMLIRADGIDVLFDLTGHNARNRLAVFMRRPAPLQVSWAGYMATTGLTEMDAIVVDPHLVPHDGQPHFAERLVRLPHSFVCYDPPSPLPDVSLPPWQRNGAPTFGCLNTLAKINDEVIALWSTILNRVPGSRLLLKYHELDCTTTRQNLAARFAQHRVAEHRLILEGSSDQAGHLATFNKIDLSLDPFPFTGSTTTLESLWMGVPVLTLPGETFSSRHSLSFLKTLKLDDFIAHSPEDYVDRAVNIKRETLERLRNELRPHILASPLCDGRRFARDLMTGLNPLGLLNDTSIAAA
jgi:predicted O-linked N-acetylglucosamine transferase (SPINDLY family)